MGETDEENEAGRQIRQTNIDRHKLSLGDVIDPDRQIKLYRN